jgi:exopolysaccharide production protein ExoQ
MASPLALAPLFVLVAVLAAGGAWRDAPALPWPRVAGALFLAGLCWAALSASWAIAPTRVPRLLVSFGLSALGGIVLMAIAESLGPASRQRVGNALVAGMVVALVVLSIEAVPRYLGLRPTPQQWIVSTLSLRFDASSLNRASAVIAISVWIAASVVARRHGWRIACLLPAWAALVAPAFESLAAVAAGAIAACAAAVVSRARRTARALMLAAIAGAFVLMPLLPNWAPFRAYFADRARDGSVWHRAEIWFFVAERIAERPLLGWGLNAARALPGGKEQIQPGVERLPLHPHNGVLQLWVELGLVGAALGAAIAVAATLHATSPARDVSTRVAMTTALAAGLTVVSVGYGLWQGWWMAALWLIAALARAVPRQDAA